MDIIGPILRGIRNGAYYGTKIRAPHGKVRSWRCCCAALSCTYAALVMTVLFRPGPVKDMLNSIVSLTYTHTKNLAVFVGLYKGLLALGRLAYQGLGIPVTASIGQPVAPWHSFVAGGIGAWFVWADYNAVNFQIVLYLVSRVIMSAVRVAATRGMIPSPLLFKFDQVYPWLAVSVWACVMYLFENHRSTVHSSLASSMDFLYHDSNQWAGAHDFLPSPATAAVVVYFLLRLRGTARK